MDEGQRDEDRQVIEEKNKAFEKLCINPASETCKKAYSKCCHKFRDDMKAILNDWWRDRAQQMEDAGKGKLNVEVWESIPELRGALSKPVRCNELNDERGAPIPSAEGRRERWARTSRQPGTSTRRSIKQL